MAKAAILIDNLAIGGSVYASTQERTMPTTEVLTPTPSDRWRSLSNSSYLVLDKLTLGSADTVVLNGLTGGPNSTTPLRLPSGDTPGAAGDVRDTGALANGTQNFDTT